MKNIPTLLMIALALVKLFGSCAAKQRGVAQEASNGATIATDSLKPTLTPSETLQAIAHPKETIARLFAEYVGQDEHTVSPDKLDTMSWSIKTLQRQFDSTAMPILIDVWMYYDVTDFFASDKIMPIFWQHKALALEAMNERAKNQHKWENEETAPFSDLIALRNKLAQAVEAERKKTLRINHGFSEPNRHTP